MHAITWTATDTVGVTSIDIKYSTNGGSTYPYTIATGISNTGSHSWTIPNTPSTTCRVKVIAHDAAGNSGEDASNSNFIIYKPSSENEVYLDPQHSSASFCNTIEVEIWANATNFQSGQINLTYDSTCANVTNWARNIATFPLGGWTHYDGREWITFSATAPMTGEYMIGTLTIHCVNDSAEGCETPLAFIEPSRLIDDLGVPVTATWIDGTFECISGLCGDAAPYPDCNWVVDMGDVTLLLNNVSYPENPKYVLCNEWAGDCRCSGVRDMGDVTLLLNNVSYPENPRYALDCC